MMHKNLLKNYVKDFVYHFQENLQVPKNLLFNPQQYVRRKRNRCKLNEFHHSCDFFYCLILENSSTFE